jgi:hypothetical protein
MAASVSCNGTSCLFERRNAAGRLLASEALCWLLFQKLRLQRLALPFKENIGWLEVKAPPVDIVRPAYAKDVGPQEN